MNQKDLIDLERPPQNKELEKVVLTLILDSNKITKLMPIAKDYNNNLFYNEYHRWIFKFLKKMYNKHSTELDRNLIKTNIQKEKDLDWDLLELYEELTTWTDSFDIILLDKNPDWNSSKKIKHYMNDLDELRLKREWLDMLETAAMQFKNNDINYNDVVEKLNTKLSNKTIKKNNWIKIADGLEKMIDTFWEKKDLLKTGIKLLDEDIEYNEEWKQINKAIGLTLQSWQLTVLGARPAMWKSMVWSNIVLNFLRNDRNCWIFSYEMDYREVQKRLLAPIKEINWTDLKKEKWITMSEDVLYEKTIEASEKLAEMKLKIFTKNAQFKDLKQKIVTVFESEDDKNKPDVVFIDHLHLLWLNWVMWNNKNEKLSEATRELKRLASKYGFFVLALSQLSRKSEWRPSKKPELADLRWSGGIEENADNVLMLFRDNYHDPDSDNNNTMIRVVKNRNWQTWDIEVWVKPQYQKIYNLKEDYEYTTPKKDTWVFEDDDFNY